jgi:hypothetical protein
LLNTDKTNFILLDTTENKLKVAMNKKALSSKLQSLHIIRSQSLQIKNVGCSVVAAPWLTFLGVGLKSHCGTVPLPTSVGVAVTASLMECKQSAIAASLSASSASSAAAAAVLTGSTLCKGKLVNA